MKKMLFLSLIFLQQLAAQSYKKIHAGAIVVDTHNDSAGMGYIGIGESLMFARQKDTSKSKVSELVASPGGGSRKGAGLTPFGEQVVKRMNELDMLIDVSHAGDQTFWDVIRLSAKPIIASHSSVYTLVNSRRNLKDDQIKAIAKHGGVIQINFNPGFIDSSFAKKETAFFSRHAAEPDSLMKAGKEDFYTQDYLYKKYADEAAVMWPPLSMLIDHIDYIVKFVGADYVCPGSDFDGITLTPQQLGDVTSYPLITKALGEKGYSIKDLVKILGGNLLRVLKANETK